MNDAVKTHQFLEALQYLKDWKKCHNKKPEPTKLNETKTNPSNSLHLHIETKSILQMEQFQTVNILSGMGKRYPQINTQGPAMPSGIQGV